MGRRRGVLISALAGALLLPALPAGAAAPNGSLYQGAGVRPGPDILYQPVAVAPQLTNTGIWTAPSILVSGATAYRHGEFLYQDFLYDDHGAEEAQGDPNDPQNNGDSFSKPDGTYDYPSGPGYAGNAADLVEFRVKPLDDSTAFRVTLNTMVDPTKVAFSVALGGMPAVLHAFPDGANVRAPADDFLTVHPDPSGTLVGDLVDATTLLPVPGVAPTVMLDSAHRQVEVRVSHTQWNPGTSVVRLAAGVGLWDNANQRYLLPQPISSTTQPGGSGNDATPAAFFNVAFRGNEYQPVVSDLLGSVQHPAWWRDSRQGEALAAHDISGLYADVDFAKLAAEVDDDSGVPQSGPIDRILQSHTEYAQGVNFGVSCNPSPLTCDGQYTGNLQPYALYVPAGSPPANGFGLTLLLHASMDNYNEFENTRAQREFAARGGGSMVLTPEGRGPDAESIGASALDVFEAWADVAAHYPLNPDWTDITGYSEGGIGTFHLTEQFPDLFARAQSIVGADTDPLRLASLRHVPVLMWNMATDELASPPLYLPTSATLDSLGYRHELDVFTPGDHTTLAVNDEFSPAAAFFGTATVERDPAHVDYVVDPAEDLPAQGLRADHAYWLSAMRIRSGSLVNLSFAPATIPPGSVDAVSYGFGVGDAPVSPLQVGAGTLTGGNLPALAYTRTWRDWGDAPATAVQDRLDLTLSNVAALTVDVQRAHLDCGVDLQVSSDGPVSITLAGCGVTRSFD